VSATLANSAACVPASASGLDAWEPGVEVLRFFVGGRELGSVKLNALVLTTPFTHLNTNLEESAPSSEALPEGMDAFVIPAQPIGAVLPSRLMLTPELIRYVGPPADRYSIDLRGTFAGYMKKFSARQRYDFSREPRKFAELSGGRIDCRRFASREEIREFHRHASRVSANSWKEEGGGPGLGGTLPEAEAIALAEAGLARGYVLFHLRDPVAYLFCQSNREHLVAKHCAYRQDYAKWSPGTVLLYAAVESLFTEQSCGLLDLGEGTLGYKASFSNCCAPCARVIYLRRSLRNLALTFTHYGVCSASVAAGRLLRTLGLKQNLKRLMMGKTRRPGQEGR
jgi:hypothetical protein